MTLFDEAERVDGRPAKHTEDSYAFLNRVASPYWEKVRAELESWFSGYPEEGRADLSARFRSRRPSQHWAAWWELYLFTLFTRLGFDVQVHPDTGVRDTKPDFRCTKSGQSFYLEAAVVFSGVSEEGRHAGREARILDLVNQAKNANFFVWLGFDQVGLETPAAHEVVKPIEDWLARLNPDDVAASMEGGGRPPETTVPVRDWVLNLKAIPVKPESRGRPDHQLLGIGPMSVGFVNDHIKLRNSLERKFGHYGRLGEPLVAGVLAMSMSVDRESVEEVLFGRIALQYSRDKPDDHRWVRQRSGVWLQEQGPVARAVSAVAVSARLRPWSCAHELPELWLNPWSDEPLGCDLPFVVATTDNDGRTTYGEAQTSGAQLLGLPEDWPGPEPPFS